MIKMIISKQVKIGEIVTSGGKLFFVCCILGDNGKVFSPDASGKKGKLLGFKKPEISINRIHHGKVLKNTNLYIGLNYEFN